MSTGESCNKVSGAFLGFEQRMAPLIGLELRDNNQIQGGTVKWLSTV